MGSDAGQTNPASRRRWLRVRNFFNASERTALAASCGSDPAVHDVAINQRAVQQRRSILAVLAIFLFYGGVISAPHWRGQADEATSRSRAIYRECASVKEDASRLACYDQAHREQSVHEASGARAMTFAELLMGLRRDSVRAEPATQR
jgi:hypothetical protein